MVRGGVSLETARWNPRNRLATTLNSTIRETGYNPVAVRCFTSPRKGLPPVETDPFTDTALYELRRIAFNTYLKPV